MLVLVNFGGDSKDCDKSGNFVGGSIFEKFFLDISKILLRFVTKKEIEILFYTKIGNSTKESLDLVKALVARFRIVFFSNFHHDAKITMGNINLVDRSFRKVFFPKHSRFLSRYVKRIGRSTTENLDSGRPARTLLDRNGEIRFRQ